MKNLKKLLLCLMLTFVVIFASGCASIQYQRTVYDNGTILDAVSVKLDNEEITNKGFNIEKVKSDVKLKMQQYLNSMVTTFMNRNDGLLQIEKISVCNNLTTKVSENENYIIASIEFRNYNTFKYFYGLHLTEDSGNDNENVVENFLFNKNLSTGKTIFSGKDAEFITNEFVSYFNGNFSIEDCDLSYVFGTPENKLHSDSDYTFTEDGVNYHQWILNSKDDTITTYTYQMKPVNWYILALVLTFVFILILFALSFIKFKKKNIEPTPELINELTEMIKNDERNKENKDN